MSRRSLKKHLTTEFIELVLKSKWSKKYKFKKQTNWKRLGNLDKISHEQFLEIIKDLLGSDLKIKTYSPKEGPNPSSKFNMYEFLYKENLIQIILSGGANLGEKYEKQFLKKLQKNTNTTLDNIVDKDIFSFYYSSSINPVYLNEASISFSGATNTRRNLSITGPYNIGEVVSDITINYKEEKHFVSLKNKNGHVFYNGKNIPFIYEENNKIVLNEEKFNDNKNIKLIFDILHINPYRVIKGIRKYKKDSKFLTDWEEIHNFDKIKLTNLIASGYGYGYYYVKEKNLDEIFFYNLNSPKKSYYFTGDITKILIKYPCYTTKSLTLKIFTNSKILGEVQFYLEFRNIYGKIVPLSLKIRTNK